MLHGVTLSPGNSEGFHFHTFISPHETANSSIPEINSPEANKTTKIMIKPRKGRLNVQVGNHLLKNQTLLDLVDGSEIRRSPVEGQVVFPIIYRVSAPSQVVQDFSHQQYQLFHPSISGLSDWMFFCSLRFLLKKKSKLLVVTLHHSAFVPSANVLVGYRYTTWKVDGATPMYWLIMVPY